MTDKPLTYADLTPAQREAYRRYAIATAGIPNSTLPPPPIPSAEVLAQYEDKRNNPYGFKGELVIKEGIYANAGDVASTPEPDDTAARLAALESEVAALKATLADRSGSITNLISLIKGLMVDGQNRDKGIEALRARVQALEPVYGETESLSAAALAILRSIQSGDPDTRPAATFYWLYNHGYCSFLWNVGVWLTDKGKDAIR